MHFWNARVSRRLDDSAQARLHHPLGRKLHLEQLEVRCLLSASPSASYSQVTADWFGAFVTADTTARGSGAAFVNTGGVDDPPPSATSSDRWVIRLTSAAAQQAHSVADAAALLSGAPITVLRGLGLPGQLLVSSVGSHVEVAAALAANPYVVSFEEDSVVNGQLFPGSGNDPFFSNQLGVHNVGQFGTTIDADIDAPEAWDETTGSPKVIVAVIDSGIDATHPDLYKNIWLNQGEITLTLKHMLVDTDGDALITFYDLNESANSSFVRDLNSNLRIDAEDLLADPLWANGQDTDGNGFVDDLFGWNFLVGANEPFAPNNPTDVLGHGTHVSGILGAMGNNSDGIAGVNWQTSIMPLKFLDENNQGSISDAILAINYATMMRTDFAVNVRVANNSWGQSGGFNEGLREAVEASGEAGILFVAAAGNGDVLGRGINNDHNPFYPANYDLDNIVSVAASTSDDGLAKFSNFGPETVDIAAPGTGVYSTIPGGGYASANGTSMAAPHVSGVAALIWSEVPDATVSEVRTAILTGADHPASLLGLVLANRRLNARGALDANVFAPTARVISAPDITISGGSTHTITIEYSDRIGIDRTTLGNTDILVARQWGPKDQIMATLDANSIVETNGGKTITANYRVAAPGGSWDPLDFGEYRISVVADEVRNGSGLAVAAETLGAFKVKVANVSVFYVDTFDDSVDVSVGDGLAKDISGRTSLRAAIQESNAHGSPTTIIIDAGSHTISRPGPNENGATSGDLDISGDITIVGDAALSSIVDAEQIDRVFEVLTSGRLVLERITVAGGRAVDGGGIQSSGILTVRQCIISDNSTLQQTPARSHGGGIDVVQGTAYFVDCQIMGNKAVSAAPRDYFAFGGALNVGRPTIPAQATVENCTLYGNSGDLAAAIYVAEAASLGVINTTISGNAGLEWGGILIAGSGTVTNSTITNNSDQLSSGGVGLAGANASVTNSIIVGNTGSYSSDVGPIQSHGHNIFGSFLQTQLHPSDMVDPQARFFLGPLQDNGGLTPTHALLPGSAAIDTADPNFAPVTDQRGVSRVQDGDADGINEPDIGAFERSGVEIRGMLFDDFNANGKQDPDEIGLGGHTVYLDLNNNRVFDAGEPFTLTEQDDPTTATIVETGQYSFLDLAPGVYHIAQQTLSGWSATIAGVVSTTRASTTTDGSQFAQETISDEAAISADGRYVVLRLTGGGTIYVKDRQTGKLEQIAATGFSAAISADGRFVSFDTTSALVPQDTNGQYDVYVFDRLNHTYERVSLADNESQANGSSDEASISADGRFIAFQSTATNLVSGGASSGNIFVRDRIAGTTQRVSVGLGGASPDGTSHNPSISGNGRFVAFDSSASNLVAGDSNDFDDVFVFDRLSGTTERLSISADGIEANFTCNFSSISDDGRWVAFNSIASNLVVGDTNDRTDIFLVDRQLHLIKRISVTNSGVEANGGSLFPVVSGDGRYIAFNSTATNFAPGTVNFLPNAFRYDNVADSLELVSVADNGSAGNGFTGLVSINGDGSAIAYWSDASNLVPSDSNNATDVFVRSLPGSNLVSQTFKLAAGQVLEDVNFGTVANPGEIHGRAFDDLIPNGVSDLGESGLAGWTIYLDDNNNGKLDGSETSTVTDAQGNYSFTGLKANANYRVAALAVSGRDLVLPAPQESGVWQVFVGAGAVVTDRDFGSRPSAPGGQSQSAIIRGTAYQDTNRDGHKGSSEPPLANKTVFLDINDDGAMAFDDPRAVTNALGQFEIANLGSVKGAVRLLDAAAQIQTNPVGNQFATASTHVTNSPLLSGNLADVVTGDFDGDGWQDVAMALGSSLYGYANSVMLLRNDRSGGFSGPPVNFDLSGAVGTSALTTGYFNNNSQLDLAVASSTNSMLSVLLDFNPTTGNFSSVHTTKFGSAPSSIAAGDIDSDGDTDLVLANDYDNTISILKNNGAGQFTQSSKPATGGHHPIAIVLGYFNNDSRLDIAVAEFGQQPSGADFGDVAVFLGQAGGAFASPVRYSVGAGPASLAVQDLDGDGDMDLAVTNFLSNNISLLLNQGSGAFVVAPNPLSSADGPIDVSASDLEGDGDYDLVLTGVSKGVGNMTLLRNKGGGIFEPGQVFSVAAFPAAQTVFYHAVANIDNDPLHTPDIVIGNGAKSDVVVNLNTLVNGAHRVSLNGTGITSGLDFGLVQQNAVPTINAIPHPPAIDEDAAQQTVQLSGISAGLNESQALIVTASSDNPALIPNPTVNYIGGQSVGSIQYTPLFNQYGVAHITVTVTDAGFNGSFGDEDDASISQIIDAVVNSVNDPPIAAADSFTVSINSSANTLNVLTNDSIAPDSGEVLRVIFVGPTSGGGNVVISTDRSKILYSPAPGFSGTDTFTYIVSDGDLVDDATVQVQVGLRGDYDRNGSVQQADYVTWRAGFGNTGTGLAADGNGNNGIDAADYVVWRKAVNGAPAPPLSTESLSVNSVETMSSNSAPADSLASSTEVLSSTLPPEQAVDSAGTAKDVAIVEAVMDGWPQLALSQTTPSHPLRLFKTVNLELTSAADTLLLTALERRVSNYDDWLESATLPDGEDLDNAELALSAALDTCFTSVGGRF